jgi:hypothetical protein
MFQDLDYCMHNRRNENYVQPVNIDDYVHFAHTHKLEELHTELL